MTARTRRPLSIILFPILYILAPPLVLVQASIVNMVPLWGPGGVTGRLSSLDIVALFSYPVSALAILSVRKAGWWTFIVCSALLLGHNILAFALNPLVSLLSVLVFSASLIAAAGFFFRKHLLAPYFNPRLRIWEHAPRYSLDVAAEFTSSTAHMEAKLIDLSKAGAFIQVPAGANASMGDKIRLGIRITNLTLDISGSIARIREMAPGILGYGIKFDSLTLEEGHGLFGLMEKMEHIRGNTAGITNDMRRHFRFSIEPELVFESRGISMHVALKNISKTGLLVEAGTDDCSLTLTNGAFLNITLDGHIAARGRIVWTETGVPSWRWGVKFIRLDRLNGKKLKNLIRLLETMDSTRRDGYSVVLENIEEETLRRSPYRLVLAIKRKLVPQKKNTI